MNYLARLVAFFFPKSPSSVFSVSVVDRVRTVQETGIVIETIRPDCVGRVGKYRATDWNAVCLVPVVLLPGARIRVIQTVGTTLVVEPITTEYRLSQSPMLDQKVA